MADEVKAEGVAVVSNAEAKPAASGKAAPPAPTPVTAPKAAPGGLEAKDEYGNSLGFKLDVAPGPGQGEGIAAAASRVRGWEPFKVDGEDYPYSEHNAIALLHRFPYLAKQIEEFGA